MPTELLIILTALFALLYPEYVFVMSAFWGVGHYVGAW